MHSHHTKDKGDLGVAKAFADLVSRGYAVLFPATEHAPFDLVSYRDGRFSSGAGQVQSRPRRKDRRAVQVVLGRSPR